MKKILDVALVLCMAALMVSCDKKSEDIAVSVVEVSDVDLWANTASLSFGDAVPAAVSYRVKGTDTWHDAEIIDGAFTVAPVWTESQNGAGLTVYSLPYPNAEGESFWDSGNNSMSALFGANLCQQDPEGVAYLKANMVLGAVFAPGNMYTGDFIMDGLTGTANFGKVYSWTARPSALKVSYKANVGIIDQVGSSDPDGDSYKGSQDITRIYAVVVDWTAQHGVTSGLTSPTGMWDPAAASSLDEGAIIGYASLDITASQAEFTDVEIPFVWYDTVAKPAEGNYSVVISCATSNRGDYLTGCSANELWVDDFEWVY